MKENLTGSSFEVLDQAERRVAEIGGGPIPASITYANGATDNVRLAISTGGSLIRMLKRSRRRGTYVRASDGLASITLTLPNEETPTTAAQQYADNLRHYRDYFLKNAWPQLWSNIREQLEAVSDEDLTGFVAAGVDCPTSFEAWQLAGKMGLPTIEKHKPTTLKSCKAPAWVAEDVRRAMTAGADFSHSWRGSYDYSVRGRNCDDGIYRAWLSAEYKGCGNGHYYLLISPERAIFCEDD